MLAFHFCLPYDIALPCPACPVCWRSSRARDLFMHRLIFISAVADSAAPHSASTVVCEHSAQCPRDIGP
jgi:hypothetical protein